MNYIALQKAQEELNLTPAEKERYDTLTAMHHLVMCMNDETAYMTWIWSVPDEASADDLADIAKEKDEFDGVVRLFKSSGRNTPQTIPVYASEERPIKIESV